MCCVAGAWTLAMRWSRETYVEARRHPDVRSVRVQLAEQYARVWQAGGAMTTDGEAIKHLWTHKTQDHPWLADEELVIDHAEGVWVWTERGQKLLDGFAGLAVVNVGHGRREIAEAIAEQTRAPGLLPDHAAVLQPARGRAGRPSSPSLTPGRSRLHDVRGQRLGGQRAGDADGPALLAGQGQVRQVQGHLADRRLSRRHRRDVRHLRPAPHGRGVRAAAGAGLRQGHAAVSLSRSRHRHRRRAGRSGGCASCARPSSAKVPTRCRR